MRSPALSDTRSRVQAFSLLELLAVMAIIVIMAGLLTPAIKTMTSTAGRKGAVNVVMNTLDQARATALESGARVYVLLLRRQFPDPDMIRVVRAPLRWKTSSDAATKSETGLVPLTKWIPIPKGVLLGKPKKGANVFTAGLPEDFTALLAGYESSGSLGPPDSLGHSMRLGDVAAGNLGVISFSPSGAVLHPSGTEARVIITEGVRDSGGSEAYITDRKANQSQPGGGFEIITMARFTGRSQLDVTTVDD